MTISYGEDWKKRVDPFFGDGVVCLKILCGLKTPKNDKSYHDSCRPLFYYSNDIEFIRFLMGNSGMCAVSFARSKRFYELRNFYSHILINPRFPIRILFPYFDKMRYPV